MENSDAVLGKLVWIKKIKQKKEVSEVQNGGRRGGLWCCVVLGRLSRAWVKVIFRVSIYAGVVRVGFVAFLFIGIISVWLFLPFCRDALMGVLMVRN